MQAAPAAFLLAASTLAAAGAPRSAHAKVDGCAATGTPAPAPSEPTGDADSGGTKPEASPPKPSGPGGSRRTPSAAEALGRTGGRVRCLDAAAVDEFGAARTRKGVQKRPFRKRLRAFVEVFGGAYAGDLSDTQWQAGGRVGFWFSEAFGIDVTYRLTPITLRLERSATAFTQADRYPDGVVRNLSHTVLGHLLWAPFHTKLRANPERVVHGDFILYAGAGPTLHDSRRGLGLEFGGALLFYPVRWLSLRLDLADHVLSQEILGRRRISNSLVVSFGLGLWIPFR